MLRYKVRAVYLICASTCKMLSFDYILLFFGNSNYLVLEALPYIGIWITKTLLAMIADCMLYSVPANFSIIPRGPEFLNPADVNITLHENTALSSLGVILNKVANSLIDKDANHLS
jgi:hypothetical protein